MHARLPAGVWRDLPVAVECLRFVVKGAPGHTRGILSPVPSSSASGSTGRPAQDGSWATTPAPPSASASGESEGEGGGESGSQRRPGSPMRASSGAARHGALGDPDSGQGQQTPPLASVQAGPASITASGMAASPVLHAAAGTVAASRGGLPAPAPAAAAASAAAHSAGAPAAARAAVPPATDLGHASGGQGHPVASSSYACTHAPAAGIVPHVHAVQAALTGLSLSHRNLLHTYTYHLEPSHSQLPVLGSTSPAGHEARSLMGMPAPPPPSLSAGAAKPAASAVAGVGMFAMGSVLTAAAHFARLLARAPDGSMWQLTLVHEVRACMRASTRQPPMPAWAAQSFHDKCRGITSTLASKRRPGMPHARMHAMQLDISPDQISSALT